MGITAERAKQSVRASALLTFTCANVAVCRSMQTAGRGPPKAHTQTQLSDKPFKIGLQDQQFFKTQTAFCIFYQGGMNWDGSGYDSRIYSPRSHFTRRLIDTTKSTCFRERVLFRPSGAQLDCCSKTSTQLRLGAGNV